MGTAQVDTSKNGVPCSKHLQTLYDTSALPGFLTLVLKSAKHLLEKKIISHFLLKRESRKKVHGGGGVRGLIITTILN